MTTITIDRAVVEQALHVAENAGYPLALIKALRAALAQEQAEPVAYTTGHCKERAKPGGCQLHNLHCGYPKCDRKSVQEQAEPVQEPVAEARYDGTLRWLEPHGVGLHRIQGLLYTAPPKAEPLTDEEIYEMYNEPSSDAEMVAFARAIERAHGIGDSNG